MRETRIEMLKSFWPSKQKQIHALFVTFGMALTFFVSRQFEFVSDLVPTPKMFILFLMLPYAVGLILPIAQKKINLASYAIYVFLSHHIAMIMYLYLFSLTITTDHEGLAAQFLKALVLFLVGYPFALFVLIPGMLISVAAFLGYRALKK